MNLKPKITVGIPFKNPGKYFALAIQSVFAQTFTEWELILLDDGSDDDSLEFAKSLSDPRVRVFSDGQCKKLNKRLNEMVRLAEAPYFFRMDADDIMHPERLEKQYSELVKHDSNTVVGSAAYSIDADSCVYGIRQTKQKQRFGLAACHSFIHPTVAAATSWFLENPYSEDPRYLRAEDAELWVRSSEKSRFINLVSPLLYYREVGTFKLSNYIATNRGLLNVFCTRNGHKLNNMSFIVRELSKLFLVSILYYIGLSVFLVKRRSGKLTEKEKQEADLSLSAVKKGVSKYEKL